MKDEITKLLNEMIDLQHAKVLKLARQIYPDATPEDIRNPDDFPKLMGDPQFNFEDGILAGYISVKVAMMRLIKEFPAS